jgi:NAD(P)-dependent dehydrogenase (short-subunit alcohol dehydrogenase family)
MRLKGKVAVITGAGSGIEQAYAMLFASEGAQVVVADFNGAAAEQATEQIRQKGGGRFPFRWMSPTKNRSRPWCRPRRRSMDA